MQVQHNCENTSSPLIVKNYAKAMTSNINSLKSNIVKNYAKTTTSNVMLKIPPWTGTCRLLEWIQQVCSLVFDLIYMTHEA